MKYFTIRFFTMSIYRVLSWCCCVVSAYGIVSLFFGLFQYHIFVFEWITKRGAFASIVISLLLAIIGFCSAYIFERTYKQKINK